MKPDEIPWEAKVRFIGRTHAARAGQWLPLSELVLQFQQMSALERNCVGFAEAKTGLVVFGWGAPQRTIGRRDLDTLTRELDKLL